MISVSILEVGIMPTNCYICSENGIAAVIDPGGDGELIIKHLEKYNLFLSAILITHGHFDHIGGLRVLVDRFPGVSVYIGKEDEECLYSLEKCLGNRNGFVIPDIHNAITVDDGAIIEVGNMSFSVMKTPGHTKGGITFICDNLLFCGDTLFAGGCGRMDLPGGNPMSMAKSLKRICNLPGDYKVYPGHEEITTLENERDNNYALRRLCDALS